MPKNLYPQLPTAPPINPESFNIEMVRKYYQDIANLKEKYIEKQQKYKNAYNRLLHASTGASSVAFFSGVSTIGTSVTVVGIPISTSLAIVSTNSTCVGACFLLISENYKKKLLKTYDLLDKITSSLATFEVLINLSIDDGTVIDATEFHQLQTLYLQLMTYVMNVDCKMKVQKEENFQKTIMDKITSSIYSRRSTPMLIIFDQPLFELLTLLLCGQSLLFKVDTYCSRTEPYCYGVKTYYSQQ